MTNAPWWFAIVGGMLLTLGAGLARCCDVGCAKCGQTELTPCAYIGQAAGRGRPEMARMKRSKAMRCRAGSDFISRTGARYLFAHLEIQLQAEARPHIFGRQGVIRVGNGRQWGEFQPP